MVKSAVKTNIRLVLSAVIAAAVLAVFAFAANPARADMFSDGEEERIPISNSVEYDTTTRDFVFSLAGSNGLLHSTVLDGMIVSSPVSIKGAAITMFRNGMEYTGNRDPVSEPGEYVVMMGTSGRAARMLAFTIVGKTTNLVSTYKLPDGMVVNEATFNDETLETGYYAVPMTEEGHYHIVTECIASGTHYTLETTVDRTAPGIELKGVLNRQGQYASAVRITGIGPNDTVNSTKDDEIFRLEVKSDGTAELKDTGTYSITVFDEAGNRTEKNFIITAYINTSGVAFLALLMLVVAAVIIYIVRKRRKLRIG